MENQRKRNRRKKKETNSRTERGKRPSNQGKIEGSSNRTRNGEKGVCKK